MSEGIALKDLKTQQKKIQAKMSALLEEAFEATREKVGETDKGVLYIDAQLEGEKKTEYITFWLNGNLPSRLETFLKRRLMKSVLGNLKMRFTVSSLTILRRKLKLIVSLQRTLLRSARMITNLMILLGINPCLQRFVLMLHSSRWVPMV